MSGINRMAFLSSRERGVLAAGVLLLFVIVGYVFWLGPIREDTTRLTRLIPKKEKDIRAFAVLRDRYLVLRGDVDAVERQFPPKEFSLLSFLEENANRNNIGGNVTYIRPLTPETHEPYRNNKVEVKIANVHLVDMVSFLGTIERMPYSLRIGSLSIRTHRSDPSLMDATFVISSYQRDLF